MIRVISKKDLLHLVEQNLKEMAMDFETPDRPDSGVQNKLAAGDTSFKKVPLPKTGNEPNKNFQEVLASERYKQVVQTLRRYLGANAPTLRGQDTSFQLIPMMMSAHRDIIRIERAHRAELENLAIELVVQQMGMEEGMAEGDFVFDAKIVDMEQIDSNDFDMNEPDTNRAGQEYNVDIEDEDEVDTNFSLDSESNDDLEDDMEQEMEILNRVESLDLEKAKRRMINAIIQGAAKRGHYMYHLVSDRLTEITGDPTLINKYGIMMSINDTNYWQMTDSMISGSLRNVAGKSKLNPSGVEKPEPDNKQGKKQVIYARGMNFPVLVHELQKSVLELLSKWGKSKMYSREVEDSEDLLKKEIWDLRLGPAIWDRLTSLMPDEIFTDETKRGIQNVLLVGIFKMPAKQFLVFMREVLMKSQNGRRFMNSLMRAVNDAINEEEYEAEIERMNADIDEVAETYESSTMNDFLRSAGISTDIDLDNLGDVDDEDELV